MKQLAITSAVQAFRAREMYQLHNRINGASPVWKQIAEMADEMKALDTRIAAFQASLGLPDPDDLTG